MATGAADTPILHRGRGADPNSDTTKHIRPEVTATTAINPPAEATATTSKAMELDELSPSAGTKNSDLMAGVESSRLTKENEKPAIEPSAGISPPLATPADTNANTTAAPSAGLASSQGTESAIRSTADAPLTTSTSTTGPFLTITLLLHTGLRHPYTISEKFLKKRNISVTDHNPLNMSVYTLKELIWRDWRNEWETRPSSPHSIRLIHFGKLLDDKSQLKDGRFALGDEPHVVHMTIKPQEVVDDEDARVAKGMPRDRDTNDRSPGCRCVIL